MSFDFSLPLEDYQLAFLDLETTGLDAVMGDAICEIGVYKIKGRRILDKFHSLVNPGKPVPEEAYRVHKISDQDLQYAPKFEKIAGKLVDFLDGCVLCAYNVGFDLGFIDYSLRKISYKPLAIPTVDILAMARDALNLPRYNLESVAKSLEIDCGRGLHRALDDALITYQVFLKLIDGFRNKQIENLGDYVSLYSCDNELSRIRQDQKVNILKEAVDKNCLVIVKYFSDRQSLEQERILPLRVFQEGRFYYLLYQGQQGNSYRIRLSRLLDIAKAA